MKQGKKSEALILFSRLPVGTETKTRLSPILDEPQREALHRCFWADAFAASLELRDRADLFLYWTGSGRPEAYASLIPSAFTLREQRGKSLGDRMLAAARDALEAGYERAAIVGTDIPHMRPASIGRAFDLLAEADVVLGPTPDGGYWLIGLTRAIPELFDLSVPWGSGGVRLGTLERARNAGCLCAETDEYRDLDTPDDLRAFLEEHHERGTATRRYLEDLGIGSSPATT
ncbi:TIGR04282 family arsenosugar biosynthesis glycosyltransferase [Fretibacterium sp. OH1220_COT-178]|uniref:TIGR04282 family arsenosugar biosynthesis glycosyltransferase n=1 Tax=Fretibacterium sp. OH1220_COT-178 TaxID=2491047 RepID=UPI000F5E17DF|nr:TIGR04282 family arsenosugar biosynthesis glycosyltransferase [Fretibacterium sp. OH1220_COT-178]RRD65507.1 glycosyltransferase [Fretibacterium sp. OH1220_COT-178]